MQSAHAQETRHSELAAGNTDFPRMAWLAMVAVFMVLVIRTAWIGDDAYITLRTVWNFVHGHGLRWNIDERVQAYTHPLWMFALSAAHFLTREAFFTTIGLSVLVSLVAVLALSALASSHWHALLGIGVLAICRSFVEYSTSGLENPLSHLLVCGFVWVYAKHPGSLRRICFAAALLALNRQDTILLALPALCHAGWTAWRDQGPRKTVKEILVGFAPLAAWEAFSLIYYGFPFPNTAYAKLNTGLPARDLVRQGGVYLLSEVAWDPCLVAALALGLTLAWRSGCTRQRLLVLGTALYLSYVVKVGGDFMIGRFFTVPLMVSTCLLVMTRVQVESMNAALVLVLVPFSIFLVSQHGGETWAPVRGLSDERGAAKGTAGLMVATRHGKMPNHKWVERGKTLKREGKKVEVGRPMGYMGYFAGPTVHIVDRFALTDPLLARMPAIDNKDWKMGHFTRHVPSGYVESITSGTCKMTDVELCKFYDALRTITQGEIWSWKRWVAIANMNMKRYDHWIDVERYRLPDLPPTVPEPVLGSGS